MFMLNKLFESESESVIGSYVLFLQSMFISHKSTKLTAKTANNTANKSNETWNRKYTKEGLPKIFQ